MDCARRLVGCLLLSLATLLPPVGLFISATRIEAEEEPAQEADAEAAWIQAVTRAARKGDEKRLQALAAQREGDPWLAVDALQAQGLFAAARTFAAACDDARSDSLRAYADSTKDPLKKLRLAQADALTLLDQGAPTAALKRLPSFPKAPASVPLVHLLHLQAELAAQAGATALQGKLLVRAATQARALGWSSAVVQIERDRFFLAVETPSDTSVVDALDAARQMRVAAQRTLDTADDADALLFEGGMLARQGQSELAVERLEQALRLASHPEHPAGDRAQIHATYAQVLVRLGRFGAALHHGERSRSLYRKRKFLPGVLYARSASITTYSELGLDRAVLALGAQQCDAAAGVADDLWASARLAMAIAHARQESIALARTAFSEALAAFKEQDSAEYQALVLLNRIRELHLPQQDLKRAASDLERISKLAGVSPRLQRYGSLWRADVLARSDEPAAAMPILHQLIVSAQQDRILKAAALSLQARLLLLEKQWKRAYLRAKQAVDIYREQALALGDAESQGLLSMDESLHASASLIKAAHELGDPRTLLEAIELSRGLRLLRAIGGSSQIHSVAMPQATLRHAAAAQEALLAAQQTLEQASRKGAKFKKLQQLKREADAAQEHLTLAEARVHRARIRLTQTIDPPVATLSSLKAWLQKGEAFVAYYAVEEELHGVWVTKTSTGHIRIGPHGELAPLLGELGDLADDQVPVKLNPAGLPEFAVVAASRFFGVRGIPGARRVLISPCAEVANIPWPLVAAASKLEAATLIPSASALLSMEPTALHAELPRLAVGLSRYDAKHEATKRLYVPGGGSLDPLPKAEKEAESLRRNKTDKILVAQAASESGLYATLKENKRGWSVAHFCCHGLLHHDRPSLTSLALLADDKEDGFVTAAELLSHRIRAHLVVLSACDVGSLDTIPGEGPFGLPSALLAAGSSHVLGSLWKVSDEAAPAFMAVFYAALAQDKQPATALRRAQLKFRKAYPNWRHPYFWAGWVAWGHPR